MFTSKPDLAAAQSLVSFQAMAAKSFETDAPFVMVSLKQAWPFGRSPKSLVRNNRELGPVVSPIAAVSRLLCRLPLHMQGVPRQCSHRNQPPSLVEVSSSGQAASIDITCPWVGAMRAGV